MLLDGGDGERRPLRAAGTEHVVSVLGATREFRLGVGGLSIAVSRHQPERARAGNDRAQQHHSSMWRAVAFEVFQQKGDHGATASGATSSADRSSTDARVPAAEGSRFGVVSYAASATIIACCPGLMSAHSCRIIIPFALVTRTHGPVSAVASLTSHRIHATCDADKPHSDVLIAVDLRQPYKLAVLEFSFIASRANHRVRSSSRVEAAIHFRV